MTKSIKLGCTVKDKVTGFTGVATARIEYLHGCIQIEVLPPVDKDGKRVEGLWIDEPRLEALKKKPVDVTPKATGGADRSPSDMKRG